MCINETPSSKNRICWNVECDPVISYLPVSVFSISVDILVAVSRDGTKAVEVTFTCGFFTHDEASSVDQISLICMAQNYRLEVTTNNIIIVDRSCEPAIYKLARRSNDTRIAG